MIEWKPIPGFDLLYEVSESGAIRTLRSGRILKPQPNSRGYMRVLLYGRNGHVGWRSVHRLVAMAFIPNPEGHPIVRHDDDDKSNNHAYNLLWGTQSDNMQDALRNGTHSNLTRAPHVTCINGHEYVEGSWTFRTNSAGSPYRQCLICERAKSARAYAKRKPSRT